MGYAVGRERGGKGCWGSTGLPFLLPAWAGWGTDPTVDQKEPTQEMEVLAVLVNRKLDRAAEAPSPWTHASQWGYCVLGPVVRRREGNSCLSSFPVWGGDQLEFFGLKDALGWD